MILFNDKNNNKNNDNNGKYHGRFVVSGLALGAVLALTVAGCGSGSAAGTTAAQGQSATYESLTGEYGTVDEKLEKELSSALDWLNDDSMWVTAGADIDGLVNGIEESLKADINGGKDFDLGGVWSSQDGKKLTVTQGEDGLFNCVIEAEEGGLRKTWAFRGEWNAEMGSLSYDNGTYSEAVLTSENEAGNTTGNTSGGAAGNAAGDAAGEVKSTSEEGHLSYLFGKIHWTVEGGSAEGIFFER